MKKALMILMAASVALTSCNTDGCIDPNALNYDSSAEHDDGSCVYLEQNLNFQFNSKLGAADFAFNTEALVNGRKVKFTRAQMYLSGFTFNGNAGEYALSNPHLLLKADISEYNLGYLPAGDYSTFSFSAGVDSISNHLDPASFPSSSALSANNPDHMHWGWDPGYIFFVLEGVVDTTANMDGTANAPFIFHVGTDALRVDMAFAKQINSLADGTLIEMDVDWLKLLDGTNMTGDVSTRSTHTSNNPSLAALMVSNVDGAFSVH
ncbi:MAG: hypothetical protein K9G41_07895 [Flavobacteriales bacterium]|nr:hypothetical protein [Flavobacteriales bacterium]